MFNGEITLVDMDNVKVDFTGQFDKLAKQRLPPEVFASRDVTQYWIQHSFHPDWHQTLEEMICEEGFFLNMEPIPGAIEAVHEMVASGLEVLICTSPHPKSLFCINEKLLWIKKYLGEDFVDRTIITADKTIVYGDILIDDKPEIVGKNSEPKWKHVLFEAPYNKHISSPYRMNNWSEWKIVINKALKSPA